MNLKVTTLSKQCVLLMGTNPAYEQVCRLAGPNYAGIILEFFRGELAC